MGRRSVPVETQGTGSRRSPWPVSRRKAPDSPLQGRREIAKSPFARQPDSCSRPETVWLLYSVKKPALSGVRAVPPRGWDSRGYQCGPAANATPPHTSAPATPQRRATIADSVAAGLYRVLRRRPGGNHLFRRNIAGRRLDRMKRRDVHGTDGEDLYLARPHHFAGIGQ